MIGMIDSDQRVDADEVRFVTRAELAELDLVEQLWDTLESWGMLPR